MSLVSDAWKRFQLSFLRSNFANAHLSRVGPNLTDVVVGTPSSSKRFHDRADSTGGWLRFSSNGLENQTPASNCAQPTGSSQLQKASTSIVKEQHLISYSFVYMHLSFLMSPLHKSAQFLSTSTTQYDASCRQPLNIALDCSSPAEAWL